MVTNTDWFFLSHRVDLAKAAIAEGYRVSVIAGWSGGACDEAIAKAGVDFHPIKISRQGTSPVRELPTLMTLARKYRALKPDVIHHDTPKPVIYGTSAARTLRRTAVVNIITGLGSMFTDMARASRLKQAIKWMYRVSLSNPRCHTIFENPDDRELFTQFKMVQPTRVGLIRGAGVDVQRFAPSPEPQGPVAVLMPARMLFDKGAREFAQAGGILKERGLKVRMVMVGKLDEGNPSAVNGAQLKQWEDDGWVEAWGHQDNMPKTLTQSHIVCLPSYREGLPKALIEGAACARPLVATDVTGCREICHPGVNGILVPARDAQALADGLAPLILDPKLRHTLGQRGRVLVEKHFSMQHVAESFLRVYDMAYRRVRG